MYHLLPESMSPQQLEKKNIHIHTHRCLMMYTYIYICMAASTSIEIRIKPFEKKSGSTMAAFPEA